VSHFATITQVLQTLGAALGGLSLLAGFLKWVAPWIVDRATLLRELGDLRRLLTRERQTLRTFELNAQAFQEAFQRVQSEMQEMRATFALAVVYIADTSDHYAAGGSYETRPPVPEALQRMVDETMAARRRLAEHQEKG
jgi:hypothetical protein